MHKLSLLKKMVATIKKKGLQRISSLNLLIYLYLNYLEDQLSFIN